MGGTHKKNLRIQWEERLSSSVLGKTHIELGVYWLPLEPGSDEKGVQGTCFLSGRWLHEYAQFVKIYLVIHLCTPFCMCLLLQVCEKGIGLKSGEVFDLRPVT